MSRPLFKKALSKSRSAVSWLLARVSLGVPLTVWDAGDVPIKIGECPCCPAAEADLFHLVESCPGTALARSGENKDEHWDTREILLG